MAAFSNTSFAQDTAFSSSAFDFGSGPTPPPPATVQPTRGQIPWLAHAPQRSETDVRKSRIAHGVIVEVATRQAQALDLDAVQQQEELLRELQLYEIEARSEYLEELALQREALINAEIAQYLQRIAIEREDEEAIAIIMIGAAI